MKQDAQRVRAALTLHSDFDETKLSVGELQPLKAYLPGLLQELYRMNQLDEDKE